MTMDTPMEAREWLERVRGLALIVEKWRDAGEQGRRLPRPLFEALRSTDIFRMSTPRTAGGAELDEVTVMLTIEELSRQDGSVGWNTMIASNAAVITSYLSVAGLRELYRGGSSTVVAGTLLPKGAATPADGGFRLTGRWTFASGCHQADWMVACSVVMENGKPRTRPDGSPDVRGFFVPVAKCEFFDTWHTIGLCGTGSHDWQTSDVFVPVELSFPILFDGTREPGSLSFKDFAHHAVARVAAVSLGIARDAIDTFIAISKTKTPTVATTTLANQHTVHERVGRAEALLRAGRAYLYETVRLLPYTPTWSAALSDDLRAAIRLAGAHAAQCATEAVDLMFNAAGTSGIYTSSRLQRCFRDIHVANQHITVAGSNIEMVGQYLLGLGLQLRR